MSCYWIKLPWGHPLLNDEASVSWGHCPKKLPCHHCRFRYIWCGKIHRSVLYVFTWLQQLYYYELVLNVEDFAVGKVACFNRNCCVTAMITPRCYRAFLYIFILGFWQLSSESRKMTKLTRTWAYPRVIRWQLPWKLTDLGRINLLQIFVGQAEPVLQALYSAVPNKRTSTLIIFSKKRRPIRSY